VFRAQHFAPVRDLQLSQQPTNQTRERVPISSQT
jgi:hypothetical protein